MLVGSTLDGRYRILREIGKGGMGAVFEAVHLGTERRVAVKVILNQELSGDPQVVERFQREARAVGRVETQHIGQALDTGVDGATGTPYLVMELLDGEDLSRLLRRLGPLEPDLAVRIAAQACVGLARAHEAGIVHRDIKPANLFLARRDRGEIVVKLLDFGIAKVKMDAGLGTPAAASELTRTGSLLGSPFYMSPEQAKGLRTIDHRSDLWSLGVTLYKALAGKAPFERTETIGQLILAICTLSPTPIQDVAPWVPAEVAAVLHQAMALDPADRFQSATAMLDALTAILPDRGLLHADMLRAAPAELRAQVAPRFASGATRGAAPLAAEQTVALPDVSSPLSSSTASSTPSPMATAALSSPMVATSVPGAARRGRTLPLVGLALAVAAGGAAAVWLSLGRPAGGEAARAERPSAAGSAGPAAMVVAPAPSPSGAATFEPVPASTDGGPGDDVVSRLTELRRRFEAGKLSQASYQAERKKILDGM